MRIAVIGAGISGLLNAYRLSSKHQVTIYEQTGQIGGLCAGFESEGVYLDRYNHFFSKADKELLDLISDLGLNDSVSWKKVKQSLILNGKTNDLSNPLGLIGLNRLGAFDKIKLAKFLIDNKFSKANISLNDHSADDWIIDKCGINVFNLLFRPLLDYKTQSPKDISALYLKARLDERKNNTIATLKGGMRTLIVALREKLHNNKANIWLNSKVKKIMKDDKDKWQVLLASGSEEYDLVICCTSLNDAAALFVANPGFPVGEYLNVGSWVLDLKQPINKNFWLFLVDDEHKRRHVVINTLPLNADNLIYFSFYLRNKAITDKVKQEMFDACLMSIKKIEPNFNENQIKQKFFHHDKNAEPVFTKKFIASLYAAPESFNGLYLSDLVYLPNVLKTVNNAIKKSSIIRQRIRNEHKT